MTYAWTEELRDPKSGVWGMSWGIDAPWAHPFWKQYALHLYELTTATEKPPTLYLPDATHEFLLYALHPSWKLEHDKPLSEQTYQHLDPPNCGYQFRADSNEAACKRVQAMVDEIVAERLSPDTDYRSRWDAAFADGYALVVSRLAQLAEEQGHGRGTEH